MEEKVDGDVDLVGSCCLDQRPNASFKLRSRFAWRWVYYREYAEFALVITLESQPARSEVHRDSRDHGRPNLQFVIRWDRHRRVVLAQCTLLVHKPHRLMKSNRSPQLASPGRLAGGQLLAECQGLRFCCGVCGPLKSMVSISRGEVSVHDKLIDFVAQLLGKAPEDALNRPLFGVVISVDSFEDILGVRWRVRR